MAQQINLCTPILLTQKRYFSAKTMVQALAVIVAFGGGLCAYWVLSLNSASQGFKETLAVQSRELDSLNAALKLSQAGAGPVETRLTQELTARKAELMQREQLLQELERGLFLPGWGHSDRLRLLAQSIPPRVWLTEVKADEQHMKVSGFTLDPAELNAWVKQLTASALLQGQELASVKVESAVSAAVKDTAVRPTWSFSLLSSLNKPVTVKAERP